MNFRTIIFLTLSSKYSAAFICDFLPFEVDWGSCPQPQTVQNFNPGRFTGTWYDVSRYKNTVLLGKCGTANYQWNPSNQSMGLVYTNLESKNAHITLTPINLNEGKFRLYRDGRLTPLVYQLLDTEYENYSIVWTCLSLFGLVNTQSLNIFGRTSVMSQELLDCALSAIRARNLDTNRLRAVVQDDSVCRRNQN